MTTDVIERLQIARDYIADRSHWTQFSRWSPDGIQNCALGESPQGAIVRMNSQGHQATIDMFNRAIEAAIAELVAEAEPRVEMACAD